MLLIHNYPAICEDLKPCPFCGATPMWLLQGNESTKRRLIVVQCGNCSAKQETAAIHDSTDLLMKRAIEKWNRRIKE